MQYLVHQFNQTLALIRKCSSGADKLFVYALKPNFINQYPPQTDERWKQCNSKWLGKNSAAFVSQPENVGTISDPETGFSNSFSEQEHKELSAILVATQNMTEI